MDYTVCEIFYKEGKKTLEAEQCEVLANLGIKGDTHADGSDKQISLLSREAKEWMATQDIQGLCFSRCKGNFIVGQTLSHLQAHDSISINNLKFEVTIKEKKCYFQECNLHKAGIKCMLKDEFAYVKALESGLIQKG